MTHFTSGILAFALIFGFAQGAFGQTIDWEIINRFRVIDGEVANNNYIGRLQGIARGQANSPLIVPRREGGGPLGSELNYKTFWDESQTQYKISWVHDRKRRIRVTTSGVRRGSRCTWQQDGKPIAGRYCSDREITVPLGSTSKVTISVERNEKTYKDLAVTIEPKDVFIAVVGDSYASGEANPHLMLVPATGDAGPTPYPAIWWDTRCHRSLVSAPVQAAALLAERNPKQSVTFVSYACSGAEIKDGIRTAFEGRETILQITRFWEEANQTPEVVSALKNPDGSPKGVTDKLEPQINRLEELLCPPKNGGSWDPDRGCADTLRRRPDILIVSIGGNDIGFGEIGRRLLLSNPDSSSDGARKKWRQDRQKEIEPLFNELDNYFSGLADEARTRIGANRVMLVEYINPTMYSIVPGRDEFCGKGNRRYDAFLRNFSKSLKDRDDSRVSVATNSSLYNFLITRDESEFANWVVIELNKHVRKAADLRWTGSDKPAETFPLENLKSPGGLRRGICASNSWFTGILESWARQGWIQADENHLYALKIKDEKCPYRMVNDKCMVPAGNVTSGVLHPNFYGHYNAGRVILLQMEEALAR